MSTGVAAASNQHGRHGSTPRPVNQDWTLSDGDAPWLGRNNLQALWGPAMGFDEGLDPFHTSDLSFWMCDDQNQPFGKY